jgi:RimJ/RimL family protein N-acetyltransferase
VPLDGEDLDRLGAARLRRALGGRVAGEGGRGAEGERERGGGEDEERGESHARRIGAIAGVVTRRRALSWHAVDYGPPPSSRALNVGISLAPERRGTGYGTQAQRALADYLFATYPLNRVEASTDVTNVAERRALEKAGFDA